MGIFSGYENQKRILYLTLLIAGAFPIIYPFGLPVAITPYTQMAYDSIEALPAGSVVMLSYGLEAGAWGELESQIVAVSRHVSRLPLKVIYVATWGMGPQFIDLTLDQIDLADKVYGEDYINIGYVPGWETGIAGMANNFHGLVNKDYYGNSIEGTFLDDVNTAADIDMVVGFTCGSGGAGDYVAQMHIPYGTKVIVGAIGVMVPNAIPDVQAGLYTGMIASLRGGAEYELLVGHPGLGLSGTDVLTFTHLWIIVVMIIGNLIHFFGKGQKEQGIAQVGVQK